MNYFNCLFFVQVISLIRLLFQCILGIVLGVLYVGGSLMCTDEMKPGSMMAFLVATQTIQK